MAYYSEPDETPTDETPKEDAPEGSDLKPEGDDESMEGETGLVSKSVFGNKDYKPGDKCEFEVVHVYDDELEVRHVGEKSGSGSAKEKMHSRMEKYSTPMDE